MLNSTNSLKIGVIHIYNFPYGLAPTTRITAYCKGLISQGHHVDIFSIEPQNNNSKYPIRGYCDGGNYFHFSRMPKRRIPLITGWTLIIYNIIRLLLYIRSSHKKHGYDAMILSCDEPYQLRIFSSYLKFLKNIKVIAIADEYPIPIRKYLKDSIPVRKINRYKSVYGKIDARILMTKKLQQFYDEVICEKPTLLLSTIVDTDRFMNLCRIHNSREYMCYMGNMELTKDNVDNIIYAFNYIKDKYPDLDLHLYGDPCKETFDNLTSIIKNNNLESRVYIKGRVSYNEVPSILYNAKILVSSQPDTKRAEGGFPTKLGEYFMTGVPTLLTDVGEITKYVHNNVNGYCVPPCDPQAYANMIEYIMEHYDESLVVAQNAKKYIIDNFGYQIAGEKIKAFINKIDNLNH